MGNGLLKALVFSFHELIRSLVLRKTHQIILFSSSRICLKFNQDAQHKHP